MALDILGGTSPYTANLLNNQNGLSSSYSVNGNTIAGVCTGSYTVTITDANEAEIIINKMRDKLRKEYLQKIEKGEFKIQTGMIYNNLIHSLEKVGDHVHNITEAITVN